MKEKIKDIWGKIKEKLVGLTRPDKAKKIYITAIIIAAVLIIITTVCGIYVNDYYRADGEAVADAMADMPDIEIYELDDGTTVYSPAYESSVGFIFYPGGKVEARAYEPLMAELASRGIVSVLCEMPFNLAVLDVAAAEGIPDRLDYVDSWYIGGHSLGGSMAASYLADHTDKIDGLVLLGSYSTADLGGSRVLSVYGSEDGVMNREKYEQYRSNPPDDFTELIISGGNHAYFGMYGEQEGDGVASITAAEQIDLTATYIAEFIMQ